MATINLRDYYPFYQDDVWFEISDDLAAQLEQWNREESNCQRKRRRYHDYSFSDFQAHGENRVISKSLAPDELYERGLTRRQLHAALSVLPDKQAKRIYAYCVLGRSMTKIAAAEGVSYGAVRSSILRGLKRLAIHLQKENF